MSPDQLQKLLEKIVKMWNEMKVYENPFNTDQILKNQFMDLFDDMFKIAVEGNEHEFSVKLSEVKYIYRLQTGDFYTDYNRMIPDPKYTSINRWSPKGTAYLYLGYGEKIKRYDSKINYIEKTCLEEMRVQPGDRISICKFHVVSTDSDNQKVFDISYNDKTMEELDIKHVRNEIKKIKLSNARSKTRELINLKVRTTPISPLETVLRIEHMAKFNCNERKKMAISLAKQLLKLISDAIFLPLDDDRDEREKEFAPFHALGYYLKEKGYCGIIYRSTRMEKLNLRGKNLVLFDKDDATFVNGSMRYFLRQRQGVKEIRL